MTASAKFRVDVQVSDMPFSDKKIRYALVLIGMYNVLDLIGRYLPLIKCLKITNRKVLMAAILSRFLFIPLFYFTAKYGDQGYMILLTSFLGLTNGFLTVCVLAEAPNGYKAKSPSLLMQITYFEKENVLPRRAGDFIRVMDGSGCLYV